MISIKEIHASETIPIRHAVLRPGKPAESCHFDGDSLDTTHHYGILISEKVAAVVTVLENRSPAFTENSQFQIRGMAILDEYRKNGYGEDLLLYAENQVSSQKGELIWFNARITAVGFYEKYGYAISGKLFDIPGVGPHYLMFKVLSAKPSMK